MAGAGAVETADGRHWLLAGRVIDRADAAMLLRENREEIDFEYLLQWINRLALAGEYSEIWRESRCRKNHRLPLSPLDELEVAGSNHAVRPR